MSNVRHCFVAVLSLGLMLFVAGCGKKTDEFKTVEKNDGKLVEVHTPGPHGGEIVDVGNHKYRAEIVFKKEDRELSIYLLQHNDNNPAFSKDKQLVIHFKHHGKEVEAKLDAAPQAGDKDDMVSCFQAKGDKLTEELHDEHDLEGGHFDINMMVDGKSLPFTVEIEEHDDHDHDKDKKKHDDDQDKEKDNDKDKKKK